MFLGIAFLAASTPAFWLGFLLLRAFANKEHPDNDLSEAA
jgi:ABC-type dipeptide/oligopeptide/nickel transport system permease component